jgi:hypothetical protein
MNYKRRLIVTLILLIFVLVLNVQTVLADPIPDNENIVYEQEELITQEEYYKAYYEALPVNKDEIYKPTIKKPKFDKFPISKDECYYIAIHEINEVSSNFKEWSKISLASPINLYDIEDNVIGYIFNTIK